jgi:hypothetical protein
VASTFNFTKRIKIHQPPPMLVAGTWTTSIIIISTACPTITLGNPLDSTMHEMAT